MATMYEMIMDLPLFKGVSKELVSSFLEKTNINFVNFSPGDKIVSKGEEVRMVKFVISGEVRVKHVLKGCNIVVEEICSSGRVLGADRLYGMDTGYSCDVEASAKTSIMEFRKDQYVRLINSDHIYLLNFFNYLSRRAQRPVEALENFTSGDLKSRLDILLSVLTDPDSVSILIRASVADLARYGATSEDRVEAWIRESQMAGLVDYSAEGLKIASRAAFLA